LELELITIDLGSIPKFLGWKKTENPKMYVMPNGQNIFYDPSTIDIGMIINILDMAHKLVKITYQ